MRISDWSSDVCSSDLRNCRPIEAISARFDPLPPSNSFERSAVVASPPNKCTIFVILCSCCPGEEVAGGIGSPPFAVDSVLLLAVSGWPASMTGLPMVEDRLTRAAAEGQNRYVATKGERPGLTRKRLPRFNRRDLIPGKVPIGEALV